MAGLPGPPRLAGHQVRRVQPVDAGKDYRCPDCAGVIPAGTGHVVVWPDRRPDLRRHWHHHCWRIACNRGRVG